MATYNELERNVERNAELNVAEKQRAIAAANQNSAIARFVRIIYFLFGILEALLAVRVVLHLLAANTGNAFADLIYGLTNPFAAPFSTLLVNPTIGTAGMLEVTTIIAMVAYAILAWVIGRIVWLTLSRPR